MSATLDSLLRDKLLASIEQKSFELIYSPRQSNDEIFVLSCSIQPELTFSFGF